MKNKSKMKASELIGKLRSTRGYDYLKEILGKELDLVHDCLTKLYNASDENAKIIAPVLKEIEKIKK